MLKKLQEKNTEISVYTIFDNEFNTFGRVINNIDTSEIISAGETFEMVEGISYMPSVKEFEEMPIAKKITDDLFGTLPIQIGYCCGHSRFLNAAEWHTSNEINIAITDFVLILGHIWDIKDGKIDSSSFKAFYVPKGTVIEVYSTSLHYCPCQVSDNGFKCVVILQKGTNTGLTRQVNDPRITAKNKWLIAHVDNKEKINQGVIPGVLGINYRIKY